MKPGKTIHIIPSKQYDTEGKIRSQCEIERRDDDQTVSSDVLWYEYQLPEGTKPVEDAEAFLIACIMLAMQEERSLHVYGSISQELLSNLEEFCSAWHAWMPWRYKKITFTCDTILENTLDPSGDRAILAFSGGLDSTFSLWQHAFEKAGYANKKIEYGVFVHGFDVPINDDEGI